MPRPSEPRHRSLHQWTQYRLNSQVLREFVAEQDDGQNDVGDEGGRVRADNVVLEILGEKVPDEEDEILDPGRNVTLNDMEIALAYILDYILDYRVCICSPSVLPPPPDHRGGVVSHG